MIPYLAGMLFEDVHPSAQVAVPVPVGPQCQCWMLSNASMVGILENGAASWCEIIYLLPELSDQHL